MTALCSVWPIFREWSAIIDIHYRPSLLTRDQVEWVVIAAGKHQGIGAFRPKYGRFDVEILGERK